MDRRQFIRHSSLLLASTQLAGMPAAFAMGAGPQWATDGLAKPPRSAWPWVYSFWLDGNVTKEGITADLEAMNDTGIGGLLFMDGSLGGPKGPHRYMSDSWHDQFEHMLAEARRLGIEVNLNNGPGWAGSPGPWNTAEHATQKVIHSQKVVTGPATIDDASTKPTGINHDHYQDIAVLAFPIANGKAPDFRIPGFDSTKSFSGGADFAGVVPWPRMIATDPAWPAIPAGQTLSRAGMRDLLGDAKGGPWQVPAGDWLVLRFGHTVSNGGVRSAQAEAAGFECDKLSKTALDAHFGAMVGKLADAPVDGRKAVVSTHIDSWEAGSGNWTAGFREEFRRRRGYDLLGYLPTLAGFAVDSREVSERFLWDFRETIAEMMLDNYAGHMADLAHDKGLRLSIEAYDGTCDDLRYAGRADEPMSEFWRSCYSGLPLPDINELAASAAHVYGKNVVGSEAFTAFRGDYLDTPATLKPLADWAFCTGINRFYFAEWVMEPWPNVAPGVSFGTFGTPFQRNVTWWPQSKPWHDYVARCQDLLRQGTFVADICFVAPEGAPYRFTPPIPATERGVVPTRPGYNFDGCPAELVLDGMSVRDGKCVLPSGMEYRLLVLPTYDADGANVIRLVDDADYSYKPMPMPKVRTMTPELLRRVKELVEQGATVLGHRPIKSPSLAGFPDCDTEVRERADALWGIGARKSGSGERRVGKGRVIWGRSPEQILAAANIPPDFACGAALKGKLNYIHRRAEDGTDIYFVVNKQAAPVSGSIAFRVGGKAPKLLWPQTGAVENIRTYEETGGITNVQLSLAANESVFVLFGLSAGPADRIVSIARDGTRLWPETASTGRVTHDSSDDSFIMASWMLPAGPIPMPVKTANGLSYTNPAPKLPGPGFSTVMSPGQGRAGFSIGTNGIVVFRYGQSGVVEPMLAYAASLVDAVHVGIVYERRVPRLFLNGKLVATGPRLATPLYDATGPDDRRPFAGELAALAQFEDMLAAQGIRHGLGVRAEQPALDYSRGLIWESGTYAIRTARGAGQAVKVDVPPPQAIEGPWDVAFDPAWGGPAQVTFDTLDDWSKRPEPGIRYYSGAARYRKRFDVAHAGTLSSSLFLDLGDVAGVAEVFLNGMSLGILWTAPYRIDVTPHLKPGGNLLEVRLVNRWINRLIGDEDLPDDATRDAAGNVTAWPDWLKNGGKSPTGRFTFSSVRQWKKGSPLVQSGLLGPVRLLTACKAPA